MYDERSLLRRGERSLTFIVTVHSVKSSFRSLVLIELDAVKLQAILNFEVCIALVLLRLLQHALRIFIDLRLLLHLVLESLLLLESAKLGLSLILILLLLHSFLKLSLLLLIFYT